MQIIEGLTQQAHTKINSKEIQHRGSRSRVSKKEHYKTDTTNQDKSKSISIPREQLFNFSLRAELITKNQERSKINGREISHRTHLRLR
jgi:hypothetical protein